MIVMGPGFGSLSDRNRPSYDKGVRLEDVIGIGFGFWPATLDHNCTSPIFGNCSIETAPRLPFEDEATHELYSKLLVSPLITPIVVPYNPLYNLL